MTGLSPCRSLALALLGSLCAAALPSKAEEAPFERSVIIVARAVSAELLDVSTTEEILLRSDAVLRHVGQIVLPVNEHFMDMEIVEAATLKADGRRIDVPADRILASSLPNASQLGIYQADLKLRTIVFPDVAVGDTLRYAVRIKEKARGLPGGLSLTRLLASSGRISNATVTLDAPADLDIRDEARGFERSVEDKGGRRIVTWRKNPAAYKPDEPGSVHPIDFDPMLLLSSYRDWSVIGRAFLDGAAPTSVPDDSIRALAETITKGVTDRREQARAIHDWVARNVRYFAVFLGTGGYVPHSAAEVLANKYGDCKDQATLMRALLAAKGIEAEYALISLMPYHQQPSVPMPDWFNHVILWLPEFGGYDDPTSSMSSFMTLPAQEADKAVLRISANGSVLTRTPPLSADSNRLDIDVDAVLARDGTVKGEATIRASGAVAAHVRDVLASGAAKGGEAFGKELLKRQNVNGAAKIDLRATDLSDPFVVRTSFDLSDEMVGEGEREGKALATGPRPFTSAITRFNDAMRNKPTRPFLCEAQVYEQRIRLQLPEGVELANAPKPVSTRSGVVAFTSSAEIRDGVLHVNRRVETNPASQSCNPDMAKEAEPAIRAAMRNYDWKPKIAGKKAPTEE